MTDPGVEDELVEWFRENDSQARRHGWGRGGGRPTCPEGGGARWGGQVPLW